MPLFKQTCLALVLIVTTSAQAGVPMLTGGNALGVNLDFGTTDNQSLCIMTNGACRMTILPGGQIGVGNNWPMNNGFSLWRSVDGNSTWTQLDSSLVVNSAGTGSYHMGAYINVRANHPSGTIDLLRNYFTAEMSGDGEVKELYGMRGIARLFDVNPGVDTSSGKVWNGFGGEFYVGNSSTDGSIRNGTGIYISRVYATGYDPGFNKLAIGLRIDNIQASGGDTNKALAMWINTPAPSLFDGAIQAKYYLPYNGAFSSSVGSFDQPFDSVYAGGFKAKVNGYEFAIYPGNMNQNMHFFLPTAYSSEVGQAMIDTGNGVLEFGSVSDVQIQTPGTPPTCNSALRGKIWNLEAGVGFKDVAMICQKDEFENFAWNQL